MRPIYSPRWHHLYGIERKRIAPIPEHDLRLHRLERPEPWGDELRQLMWGGLPDNIANHYPDYAGFHERLATFSGVAPEQLVIGQGIESLIRDLALLCCDRTRAMAFLWPSCRMFGVYAQGFASRAVKIDTDPDNPPSMADIWRQISDDVGLFVLANPGQPVETHYGHQDIERLAIRLADIGAVLAIDEAYWGFGVTSSLPLIEEYGNVVVLRTFSKALGGAALRIGYAMGRERTVKPLDAVRQSGEVAGPSMHAATVLMDRWNSHVQPGIAEIVKGRDWLRERLTADGYTATGRLANHVLVDMGSADLAIAVAGRLRERGVHVRVNEAPVDHHLMVTAGSVGLMQRFCEAFRAAT